MNKEFVKFLGRGAAFNYLEDNTSCYFKLDKHMYLIDCGEKICSKILYLGLLENIDSFTVIITHLHSDHIGSLEPLLTYIKVFKPSIDVNVIYPEKEKLSRLLTDLNYSFSININEEINRDDIKVIPCFQKHIEGSYGYFFFTKEINFFYSGDTSLFNEEAYQKLKNHEIDCIFHEVSERSSSFHTGIDLLDSKVNEEDREKFFLMHFENKELIEKVKSLHFNVVEPINK